mgnify:CR=1 FL=1
MSTIYNRRSNLMKEECYRLNSVWTVTGELEIMKCNISKKCGGCQFQGIPYKEQLKKKQKKEEQMRNNLQVGDEIITIAGTYGRVVAVKEDSLVIESGPDRSKMKIARWAINQNLTVHDDTPEKK